MQHLRACSLATLLRALRRAFFAAFLPLTSTRVRELTLSTGTNGHRTKQRALPIALASKVRRASKTTWSVVQRTRYAVKARAQKTIGTWESSRCRTGRNVFLRFASCIFFFAYRF